MIYRLLAALTLTLTGCANYTVQLKEPVYAPWGSYGSCVNLEVAQDAFQRVKALHTYKWDDGDQWSSFAAEVLAGVPFEGDCEDFAITGVDHLVNMGYDRRHFRLAIVNGGSHAVAIIDTCNEGQWVIDNQRNALVPVREYPIDTWQKVNLKRGVWKSADTVAAE